MVSRQVSRQVLVVAAHPDDEILGCGATIAKHVQSGDVVRVVIVADGATSREQFDSDNAVGILQDQAKTATKYLGVVQVTFLRLRDQALDTLPFLRIVTSLESIIEGGHSQIIYTHHGGDLNLDHRIVHDAVITAARPMAGSLVIEMLEFEVLSSTEWAFSFPTRFEPDIFVDVTKTLNAKLEAMRLYTTELRSPPHPRSIENLKALARFRGSTVGVEAAEAFKLIYARR